MALIKNGKTHTAPPSDERPSAAVLINRLSQGDAIERRNAARELAAFPEAVDALVQRLDQELEHSVQEALVTSLACLADATAVAALLDCLRSEDVALRNDVIEALKSAGQHHPALIQETLTDPDPDVRILAIGILESLKHPDVELWLIELIEHDEHVNVCACAVDLLCEVITSERAVPALELCLARFPDEDYLHFTVDLALQRLRGASLQ